MSSGPEALEGWIPMRLHWQGARPQVEWMHLGAQRFEDPFFDDTIQKAMRDPFNVLFRHRTSIETLEAFRELRPGVAPQGFIFHMSRCGSTLVSRMLASLPRSIVLSEAGPIDSVLRAGFRAPSLAEAEHVSWLRGMVSALGQRRAPDDNRLFIKFDSWSIVYLGLIERAFPEVPWLFVYRDPVEVMVSQILRRGAHFVPGVIEPDIFGLDSGAIMRMPPEEFCARVLGTLCDAAQVGYAPAHSRLINYRQLPGIVESTVLDFFGVSREASDLDRMRDVALFDAKNPSLTFQEDAESKSRQASELVREMARRFVMPSYEQLESLRQCSPTAG